VGPFVSYNHAMIQAGDDHHRLPGGEVMQFSALKLKESSSTKYLMTLTAARAVTARQAALPSTLHLWIKLVVVCLRKFQHTY
jgi:hypothetical protein